LTVHIYYTQTLQPHILDKTNAYTSQAAQDKITAEERESIIHDHITAEDKRK